jgi:pimeloyl-ACP methyl ester carboxylesterase
MKKALIALSLILASIIFFSRCYLNRYMYSDGEIEAHYTGKSIKPQFKTASFLGRKLHYAMVSKSDTLPLLVMVHGAPGAWYGYLNLVDDSVLQQNFRIISVDRMGYGKSGYGSEELSVQKQALAVKTIIDKENKDGRKVYLLGRSYGAPIAAWLAINYPQQVEKLVMASPVIDPAKEKFYWFSDLGRTAVVQWMLPDMLNVATREKFSHQKEMAAMLPKWNKLCVPTCVVVGEDDNVADTANFSFAKTHLVNCPAVFMKVKETGHQVTQKRPELIRDLIMNDACDISSNCVHASAPITEFHDNRQIPSGLTVNAADHTPLNLK